MAKTPRDGDPAPVAPVDPVDPLEPLEPLEPLDALDADTKVLPTVLPTEQLETTPAPVSASAAAGAGATGLTAASETSNGNDPRTLFGRHPVATAVVAGAIAVVIASGLTAWGVGTAVTASLTNQTAPFAAPSTETFAPQADGVQRGPLTGARVAFRATIQSIDASTWTILTRRDQTVTVTIDSSTRFGTKRMSETQSSFAVGDSVVIVAAKSTGTATAVRVVAANDAGAGAGSGARTGSGDDNGDPTPTPSPTSTATT